MAEIHLHLSSCRTQDTRSNFPAVIEMRKYSLKRFHIILEDNFIVIKKPTLSSITGNILVPTKEKNRK